MAPTSSTHVAEQHSELLNTLPFADTDDFDAATRGFIGALDPAVVRDASGKVVWDMDSYAFLDGEAPPRSVDILIVRFRPGRGGCPHGCKEEELHPEVPAGGRSSGDRHRAHDR